MQSHNQFVYCLYKKNTKGLQLTVEKARANVNEVSEYIQFDIKDENNVNKTNE